MPLVNDTVIANLHRADLGDAIAIRPGARRLDVDHHVVLLGIETIIHPTDLGHDPGGAELAEAGQLVAADHVPPRPDLPEGRFAVLHQHQVRETVARPAEVVAHAADYAGKARRIGSFEQRAQRLHLPMIPAEDPVDSVRSGATVMIIKNLDDVGSPHRRNNWEKYLNDPALCSDVRDYISSVCAIARTDSEGQLRRGHVREALRHNHAYGVVSAVMWGYPKGRLPGGKSFKPVFANCAELATTIVKL